MGQFPIRHGSAQGAQPEPPGVGARRAALRLIDAVERRGEPMDQALAHASAGLSPSDRALAIAIASEALRHQASLDSMVDERMQHPLPQDSKTRAVIRMALAQHFLLNTPSHAVIATSLPLLQGGPRRLAHAVMSRVMREVDTLPEAPALPAPCRRRWLEAWGEDVVQAAERGWSSAPALDLSLATPDGATAFPDAIQITPTSIRLPRGQNVPSIAGFDAGGWWVQNVAAAIAANLLGPGRDRHVLDLCAAPGGKTLQLSAAGWQVTAVDQSSRRMARLEENLKRTGLSAKPVIANLLSWEPHAPAEAVLLDAPCTSTGIFRRHPDVLYRVTDSMIATMAELQAQLLARAADWVLPGGHLVYATCSLEPAEGEEQARAFLAQRPDFKTAPVTADELPEGIAPTPEGWVRTLPTMRQDIGGIDGFFIARFVKA